MSKDTNIHAEIRAMSDRAYSQYIQQMSRPECLGWEAKAVNGRFGIKELEAHTTAGELLGRHRALAEAATMLAALPAQAVALAPLLDHQVRELVNSLRDAAIAYHGHQSLRVRIANLVARARGALDQAVATVADEPVFWMHKTARGYVTVNQDRKSSDDEPLFTLPAPVQAVAPTDAQLPVLNCVYETQAGEAIKFVAIHNAGTSYETMEDQHGVNRYTRRAGDIGRVTGTPHDWSDPRNLRRTTTAQPAAQPADAQDAARYRLVRRGQHWSVIDGIGDTLRAEALDAAVDTELGRTQGGSNG